MGHHPERMHSGIGAAGTVDARLARKKFGERSFNFFLHPGPDFLDLPPFVISAVVGNGQLEFERSHRELTTDGHG